MPREAFIQINMGEARMALIAKVNVIIATYQQQGYRLSLRQLYYQLVSRAVIENNLKSYKRLVALLTDARMAGLVDWDAIEDRNREYLLPSHWERPEQVIASAAASYRIDKWKDQPKYVEVMVEKDALSGVLWPVCAALDVGFTANRGYSSASAMYEAGKRIRRALRAGKECHVLYLGDHDPSGQDMTRDIRERLGLFGGTLLVSRLALNKSQVDFYGPPENPAKLTDSRARAYVAKYGSSSWELDALEPNVLAELVRKAVLRRRDQALWDAAVAVERVQCAELQQIARRYDAAVLATEAHAEE
jgi:hypothetical protein